VSVGAAALPQARARPDRGRRAREAAAALPFVIMESKLAPPAGRRELVVRTTLLDRLDATGAAPVVAVIAPPGYGKTSLLAQWRSRGARPFAWVSLDQHDNDPAVLLAHVAAALDQIEPVDRGVFQALTVPGIPVARAVLPQLGAALSAVGSSLVLVLDDLHLLKNRHCVEAIATLAEHLADGSQLVVAGCGEPPHLLARLRSEGCLAEIGRDDLAMDAPEAASLLRAEGMDLPAAAVDRLVRRTEGWPAALHLAATSAKQSGADTTAASAIAALAGSDRLLVDYLQSVLLSRLSPREVRFLLRTSVLDRMSGPLCDAVLQTTGSAQVLESLERSNLLVVPLDRGRVWYRYHYLVHELLRSQVERHEPELATLLALRASQWCEHNGQPEAAVEYTMRADAAEQAARLVEQLALAAYHRGQLGTLSRWFGWFDERGLIERYPAVTVLGAWVHALAGHPAAAERWAEVAGRSSSAAMPPHPGAAGGTPLEALTAILSATLCHDGIEPMRSDAEVALARLPAGSRWQPTALLLLAVSHLLAGEPGSADRLLATAAEGAEDAAAADTAVVALSERAILALERQEWSEAKTLVERARSLIKRSQLDEYPTSALLYAVAARVAIHYGEVRCAREDLVRTQRLRPQLTSALPWLAVQTRLELVRANVALTDAAGARTVLREADGLLLRRPQLGVLPGQAEELRAQLDKLRADVAGASSLTAAELRVLPLLSTYRSFPEIGEQLHVSRHTVKSHAMSIYRKFGVCSRSEAIQHARDLSLI